MYVCICNRLKESDVKRAARAGATTAEELAEALYLDNPFCCGRCLQDMDRIVSLAHRRGGKRGAIEFLTSFLGEGRL